MTIPPILSIIAKHAAPGAELSPDALLQDVGINCPTIAVSLQCEIEEAIGDEFPPSPCGADEYQAWSFVGDVLTAAKVLAARVAKAA
jgi:hypothetical protein